MRALVLGSGSSGNALLLACAEGRILVDAGIGPRVSVERMRALGEDLFPRGVDAIVVTHEHGDHAAKLEPLARALKVPAYLHQGVAAPRVRKRFEVRAYDDVTPFRAGPFLVRALAVPHDAPQVALSFEAPDGSRFGLATDLGRVPSGLARFLGACDSALLESNYCPELLEHGPYPPRLKDRIRGGRGHLANEETADLVADLVGTRLSRLWLGHLSRTNNSPGRALFAVAKHRAKLAIDVIPHGVPLALDVTRGAEAREQLAFAFG